jgi:hypothetical protein
MAEVVARLMQQQTHIFEILEFEDRPTPRPPATGEQLAALEAWCRSKGFGLPPSYREFLIVCDGIEGFSLSYSLFGSIDLLSDTYPAMLAGYLANPVGFAYPEDRPPVLIAHDPETTTRVWFELSHRAIALDEPVVLDGDPGDMTLHASFAAFMRSRIDSNELTIKRLLELRSGAANGS